MKDQEILEDIANCCEVDRDNLIDTYLWKITEYQYRDIKNKIIRSSSEYSERALKTITAYYVREHNYTENWIE